jgi:MFS family permease
MGQAVPRTSTGAVSLLRENGAFRNLWLSRNISFIGDSLAGIALLLFVASDQDTGIAVALLLLVGDFTPSLLSPFLGTLSDRLDRKRLMIASELAQGAVIATIALVAMPLAALLALVALQNTLAGIFQPASRSAVNDLVPDEHLEGANAALGLGTHGFDLVGPLVGVALLPLVGIRGMLLADAGSFIGSALLLARLPAMRPAPLRGETRLSFLRDAHEGIGLLWRNRTLRIIALGFVAVVACTGADDVSLVFLARDALGGGESAASLLYAGAGIGLLIGFLLIAGIGSRVTLVTLLLAGFAVSNSGNLLTGLAWSVPAAVAFQIVRGLGISAVEVGVNTTVQRIVPAGMQGRAFANLYGFIGLAAGLSYIVGGPLLDMTGSRVILVVGGLGGLVATGWMALHLLRPGSQATTDEESVIA